MRNLELQLTQTVLQVFSNAQFSNTDFMLKL